MAEEAKPGTVATIVIHVDIESGKVDVGGHLDNLFLNLQMLAEAGHILIDRNAQLKLAADKNGNGKPS